MGCNWRWGWDNAWDCVKEGAEASWDWLKDNPDVIAVWVAAGVSCVVSYAIACGPAVSTAWGYTKMKAEEDLKEEAKKRALAYGQDATGYDLTTSFEMVQSYRNGEMSNESIRAHASTYGRGKLDEYAAQQEREIKARALTAATQSIDDLIENNEITATEGTALKVATQRMAGRLLCRIPEDVRTQALFDTKAIAAGIYRQRFTRSSLDDLVRRALSEVSYRSPAVRNSVSECPDFISDLRAELASHFVRWGAARTKGALPGDAPAPTVVDAATVPFAVQAVKVRRLRDWIPGASASPKDVLNRLRQANLGWRGPVKDFARFERKRGWGGRLDSGTHLIASGSALTASALLFSRFSGGYGAFSGKGADPLLWLGTVGTAAVAGGLLAKAFGGKA